MQYRPSVVGGCQVEEVRGYDREEEEEEEGALVGEMRAFRVGGGEGGEIGGGRRVVRPISIYHIRPPFLRGRRRGVLRNVFFCSFEYYINEEDREESGRTSSLLFCRPLI